MEGLLPFEFYNATVKQQYINKNNKKNKNDLKYLFQMSSILENHLIEDLAKLDLFQLRSVMFLLSPQSITESLTYIDLIKKYINWYRNIDPSQEVIDLEQLNRRWALQFVAKDENLAVEEKKKDKGNEVVYTNAECIRALLNFYNKYQTTSSRVYRSEKLKPSYTYLSNRYGNWNSILAFASIKPEFINNQVKYSKRECISAVEEFYKIHHSTSSGLYVKTQWKPTFPVLLSNLKCKTWNEVLLLVGITPDKERAEVALELAKYLVKFNNNDLFKIREFAQSLDKSPHYEEGHLIKYRSV
ncbi:hypothetical protein [Paenibacillus periandrae]|uniref:phage lytic cycle repressor MrpR family protein n=1 Tax=Paenibacillus periandrae TaxID=1761741 RepID=UPI001F0999FB|nr:hypothetical protein [Paenibacillus periandrae]